MKNQISYTTPKRILLFLIAELSIISYSFALPEISPLGISAYVAFAFNGVSPAALAIAFIATIFIADGLKTALVTGSSVLVLSVIAYAYKLKCKKARLELLFFVPVSLTYYVIASADVYYALILATLTSVYAAVFHSSVTYFIFKGLNFKPKPEETASTVLSVITALTGMMNVFSPRAVKIPVILFCLLLSRSLSGVYFILTCSVVTIPFCIFFQSLEYFAVGMVFALITQLFSNRSPYFSGILIITADYSFYKIFGIYDVYRPVDFILLIAVSLIYLILPNKFYAALKDKLRLLGSARASTQTLGSFKKATSAKLYEIAAVFKEIAFSFYELNDSDESPEKASEEIRNKILKEICDDCQNAPNCKVKRDELKNGTLLKLSTVGLAKNKVSFIDVPKTLAENCVNLNPLIYCANKEISDYTDSVKSAETGKNSNDILLKQAEALSEMLEKIAFNASVSINAFTSLENATYTKLTERGVFPDEVSINDENGLTVRVVLPSDFENLSLLEKTVSAAVGKQIAITDFFNIGNGKVFFSLAKPPKYKTVYGFATRKKSASDYSGDAHSETLVNDVFIGAISDGMGSGKRAKKISDVTLSLVEKFYKVGLNKRSILPLVNKILSVNLSEGFAALDVAVIDLETLSVNFIKFGAPPSFILGEKGIRIVEGNTLPIGIVKDLELTSVKSALEENDILILSSDGISDAFGSSSDYVDFIKTLPALNPSSVAESILEKALSLSGGEAKDDMTVLCIRTILR